MPAVHTTVSNRPRQAFPCVLRASAFASAPLPASLSLRSAKTAALMPPRFQPVPPPENPSVPLSRPYAPGTVLGLAMLALRVWAYANGRPLHSRAFPAERQDIAPPACPLFSPSPRPVAKTCRLWLPLVETTPPNPARLGSPVEAPLMNFQIRRFTLLFGLSAPRPFPLRGRPAQTLHFAHGFGNSQASGES